jgi:hypothetical protein
MGVEMNRKPTKANFPAVDESILAMAPIVRKADGTTYRKYRSYREKPSDAPRVIRLAVKQPDLTVRFELVPFGMVIDGYVNEGESILGFNLSTGTYDRRGRLLFENDIVGRFDHSGVGELSSGHFTVRWMGSCAMFALYDHLFKVFPKNKDGKPYGLYSPLIEFVSTAYESE